MKEGGVSYSSLLMCKALTFRILSLLLIGKGQEIGTVD